MSQTMFVSHGKLILEPKIDENVMRDKIKEFIYWFYSNGEITFEENADYDAPDFDASYFDKFPSLVHNIIETYPNIKINGKLICSVTNTNAHYMYIIKCVDNTLFCYDEQYIRPALNTYAGVYTAFNAFDKLYKIKAYINSSTRGCVLIADALQSSSRFENAVECFDCIDNKKQLEEWCESLVLMEHFIGIYVFSGKNLFIIQKTFFENVSDIFIDTCNIITGVTQFLGIT